MSNQVAKTILQQIRAGTEGHNSGVVLMMCWGTHQFINTGKGLRFKVNGALHKGYVEVTLDEAADLYDVEFYTMRRPRKAKGQIMNMNSPVKKTVKQYGGVFWEDLTAIIDGTVEKAAA